VKGVEASSNNGYEAESKAFYHNISLQKQVGGGHYFVCLKILVLQQECSSKGQIGA